MPPKVCILTTVHPRFDTRIFHKEAKTLVRAGYDVTLIAQHEEDETVDGVSIIGLSRPRNRLTRIFGFTWWAFLIALPQKADIYHFHDPELLPIGVLLKLFTRAKVIYDVHEDVPPQIVSKYWISPFLRRPIAGIFGLLEKLASRRLDAVVVATEAIAQRLTQHNPVLMHNYPELVMVPEVSRVPGNDGKKTLVYVGGISKLRGAFEMVRALDYLSPSWEVCLDLIGRFEPGELEKEIRALPGYKRVHFVGWLPWKEAWQRAQGATGGLVLFHPAPNHTRSLPNKLFEYMAAGLPVIASNFPLWKEIVEGNNCGLCVDPLDPKEIAGGIEYLITHPEEARHMGENGRRAVEEKYNWEKESEKLLALYERLTK